MGKRKLQKEHSGDSWCNVRLKAGCEPKLNQKHDSKVCTDIMTLEFNHFSITGTNIWQSDWKTKNYGFKCLLSSWHTSAAFIYMLILGMPQLCCLSWLSLHWGNSSQMWICFFCRLYFMKIITWDPLSCFKATANYGKMIKTIKLVEGTFAMTVPKPPNPSITIHI